MLQKRLRSIYSDISGANRAFLHCTREYSPLNTGQIIARRSEVQNCVDVDAKSCLSRWRRRIGPIMPALLFGTSPVRKPNKRAFPSAHFRSRFSPIICGSDATVSRLCGKRGWDFLCTVRSTRFIHEEFSRKFAWMHEGELYGGHSPR